MSEHDLSYEYIADQIRINVDRLLNDRVGLQAKGECRLVTLAEHLEAAVKSAGIVAPVPAEADETCAKCGEPKHIVAADKFECAESPAPAEVERVARAMWDAHGVSVALFVWENATDFYRDGYRKLARAAIEAMPKRPTREREVIGEIVADIEADGCCDIYAGSEYHKRLIALYDKETEQPQYGDFRNGTTCRADPDGDCRWPECPQIRDGEPMRSGRHCPLDTDCNDKLQRQGDAVNTTPAPCGSTEPHDEHDYYGENDDWTYFPKPCPGIALPSEPTCERTPQSDQADPERHVLRPLEPVAPAEPTCKHCGRSKDAAVHGLPATHVFQHAAEPKRDALADRLLRYADDDPGMTFASRNLMREAVAALRRFTPTDDAAGMK